MTQTLHGTHSRWPLGRGLLVLAVLAASIAGCSTDPAKNNSSGIQPDPPVGATEFVSAANGPGYNPQNRFPDSTDLELGGGQDGERTVEEGDIFRLMGDGLILNLNSYRGLQILDVSDPDAPVVTGALRLSGYPVEGYVVGDYAVLLLNDWYGYAWTADGVLEKGQGGAVLLVDVSDPAAPSLVDSRAISGSIRTSRLTSGGGQAAVYVAAERWPTYFGGAGVPVSGGGTTTGTDTDTVSSSAAETIVASMAVDVPAGQLVARDTIELGGWISDIHATTEALLVARYDHSDGAGSEVTVIDISDPDGTMVEGSTIAVKGVVESQFNMDIRGGILRVVSGGRWTGADVNHLETFDVTDIQNPVPVDHETFGAEQDLYATIFMEDRAFFVTYFVQDPFHAFAIDESGDATEVAEFVVSGWNDFFRPVLGDTRLVGIGVNDEGGKRKVAVSLYDVTDLANPNPLIERAEVDLEHSWSEASWEHRAFSVIEDAVAAEGDGLGMETGLVLLPYSGWDNDGYTSGVQLFTFGPDSITTRGTMSHPSPVRRTFMPADGTAANLSDVELSLYDVADPDSPAARGQLPLAPSYTHIFAYGDWLVRVENPLDYGWYDYGSGQPVPNTRAQVVAASADPDVAIPVHEFELPAGATLVAVDHLLVAMRTEYDETRVSGDKKEPYVTIIDVWDLSDPTAPEKTATLQTTALSPYGGKSYPATDGLADACWDCGNPWWWGGLEDQVRVLPQAVVFVQATHESEAAGTRRDCWTWPASQGTGGGTVEPSEGGGPTGSGGDREQAQPDDQKPWYAGGVYCTSLNGGEATCSGSIVECAPDTGVCVEVDPATVEVTTECNEYTFDRYWQRDIFHVLNLADAHAPAFAAPIEMPQAAASHGSIVDGSTLWYSSAVPYEMEGDDRAYVQYFGTAIDLSDAANPVVGTPINVPGRLLVASGSTLFTQDYSYGAELIESSISRLTVQGNKAELKARHRFEDRSVSAMMLDGDDRVLVTHGPVWTYRYDEVYADAAGAALATDRAAASGSATESPYELAILDAQTLVPEGSMDLPAWSPLKAAIPGKALLQVPGGYLLVDLTASSGPNPQAWFAALGWPRSQLLRDGVAYFAAGRYGVYALDLAETNLLPSINGL